jgi:hypothetical protein
MLGRCFLTPGLCLGWNRMLLTVMCAADIPVLLGICSGYYLHADPDDVHVMSVNFLTQEWLDENEEADFIPFDKPGFLVRLSLAADA